MEAQLGEDHAGELGDVGAAHDLGEQGGAFFKEPYGHREVEGEGEEREVGGRLEGEEEWREKGLRI